LELVLVWLLCGLVVNLARRAGDDATERSAQIRRVVYILLRISLTGGATFVVISSNRELIIGGAIAGMAGGLILVGLMMGLMRRTARMCDAWPEIALPPARAVDTTRPSGWVFRLLTLGGILLPLALVAGVLSYYQEWKETRIMAQISNTSPHPDYAPVRKAFYTDLRAGRIDEAYQSTTADFKTRISRDRLAELAKQYTAYLNGPKDPDFGGGMGSSGGGYDFLTEYEYGKLAEGKIVQVSMTIRRDRDSIFFRRPPPLKVHDFKVEETAAREREGPAFGRPAGLGP
jgi:hypothetical protein